MGAGMAGSRYRADGPAGLSGRGALKTAQGRLNPLLLQPGEFDVLATFRRGGAPHALTPTDLYEAAMIFSGSVTNRIDRLEKASLVQRRSNPTDNRATLVALTSEGLRLIDLIIPLHVANQYRIVNTTSTWFVTHAAPT